MSSANHAAHPSNASKQAQPCVSKRSLQRLRREAGYRSAREFAEKLSIPASTYARYERQPESPGCAIPLGVAWSIADTLGVSIDLVVGREDIDAPHPETLDDRASRLSRSARELLDEYLRFLEYRDDADAAQDWR